MIETDGLWQIKLSDRFISCLTSIFFLYFFRTLDNQKDVSAQASEDFNQVITSKTCNNNPDMCFSQIGVIKDSSGGVFFSTSPIKSSLIRALYTFVMFLFFIFFLTIFIRKSHRWVIDYIDSQMLLLSELSSRKHREKMENNGNFLIYFPQKIKMWIMDISHIFFSKKHHRSIIKVAHMTCELYVFRSHTITLFEEQT